MGRAPRRACAAGPPCSRRAVAPIPEGVLLDVNEPPWLAFNSGDVIEIRKEALDTLHTEVTGRLVARGLQSGVCLPLKTKRGKYGVLNVGSPKPDAFPVGEIMLLWQIARQLAVASRTRSSSIGRNNTASRRAPIGIASSCCSTSTTRWCLNSTRTALWLSVFETVRQTLDHDYASLITFEAGRRELRLEAATYYDERGVMESHIATTLDQSPAVLAIQGARRASSKERSSISSTSRVPRRCGTPAFSASAVSRCRPGAACSGH